MTNKYFTAAMNYMDELVFSLVFFIISVACYKYEIIFGVYGFGTLGLFFLGYRQLCRLDYVKNIATVQKTIFGISFKTRIKIPANSIKHVEYCVEYRRFISDTGSPERDEVFVIYLVGDKKLPVKEYRSFGKGRIYAEKTAKQLNLKLNDKSSGRLRVRQPDELDMTFGQRLRHRGKKVSYPEFPVCKDVEIKHDGESVMIKFAAQPMHWPGYFFMITVPSIFALAFWFGNMKWILFIFVLPLSVYLLVQMIASFQPGYVYVKPAGILAKRLGYREYMSFDDIEDVVKSRQDILLISDKRMFGLPYDFNDKVVGKFLIDLIKHYAIKYTYSSLVK